MSFLIFISILIALGFGLFLLKIYVRGGVCKNRHDMTDQFVIITGASSGLGKETAKDLLMQGAKVVYACRSEKNAMAAINELPEKVRSKAIYLKLDLCSYANIQSFAEKIKNEYPPINILINNAGAQPVDYVVTEDNYESFIQGNHLGPMLLTFLLLGHFASSNSRIINISSMAHYFANMTIEKIKHYNTAEQIKEYYFSSPMRLFELYSASKLMNLHFTQYLAENLLKKFSYIKAVTLHPGVVNTAFFRYAQANKILSTIFYVITPLFTFLTKTAIEGSQTHMHLCYAPFEELISGAYYADCAKANISVQAKDESLRKAIIDWSISKIKEKVTSLDIPL